MTTPGPGILDGYPYDSSRSRRGARDRPRWPGASDLAAMVGLAEPAPQQSERQPTIDDTESPTVIAARLSSLFK